MATATGIHHRTYQAELALRHKAEFARLVIMAAALVAAPSVLNSYWLGIVNTILIAVIGAVGLNILVGFTGQISLGQGGFLAVGAFTSALLSTRAGLPVPLSLLAAVPVTAAVGAMFGRRRCGSRASTSPSPPWPARRSSFVVKRWGFSPRTKGVCRRPRLNILGWQIERGDLRDPVVLGARPDRRPCRPARGISSGPGWAGPSWRSATRTSPPRRSGSTSPVPR